MKFDEVWAELEAEDVSFKRAREMADLGIKQLEYAYNQGYEQGKRERLQEWIPVSKRLPEKSGKYWCTFGVTNLTGSDYYTTESDAKKLFDDSEEYIGWQSQNVIAWMPLPKPYERGKDNDDL